MMTWKEWFGLVFSSMLIVACVAAIALISTTLGGWWIALNAIPYLVLLFGVGYLVTRDE